MKGLVSVLPNSPYKCMLMPQMLKGKYLSVLYDAFITKYPTDTCSEPINVLNKIKMQEATHAYLAAINEIRANRRRKRIELLRAMLYD